MSTRRSRTDAVLIAAIPALLVGAVLVMHAHLAHVLNVNWDEFNFLAKIHTHHRGELASKLLTFHVHFFGWVREVSTNEVQQVVAIRLVMLALGVVTMASTFFLGRALIGSTAGALFAVFAGQSFSLVLDHGTSARYDPIVVCLFMVAAALLVGGRALRAAAPIAGFAIALALMVSVKSVLYLPTLAGLLACRVAWDDDRRAAVRDALAFVVVAALSYAALFAGHAASLAALPVDAALSTGAPGASPTFLSALEAIASTVFVGAGGLPRRGAFLDSLRWDGMFWALLVVGAVLAAVGLRTRATRKQNAQLLMFALPLFALLFYRNSFEYFYVSIIPPAALLAGVLVGRIEQRLGHKPLLVVALVAVIAAPSARAALLWWRYNSDDQLAVQKQVIDVVHATFPTPVPYVDRCGMVSSFKKIGPFMSTYTLTDYRARGVPIMRELLQRERPHFILQNINSLELGRKFNKSRRVYRLLREDFDVLAASFIPHWGPLWVAGKTTKLEAGVPVALDLVIAGRYVVEARSPVTVDGREVSPRDVVDLTEGTHSITSPSAQKLTLRIASAGPPPKIKAPPRDLFRGFRYRRAPP